MIRFADVPNIVIAGTLISIRPKPNGPPDTTEMSVDGYETEVMLLPVQASLELDGLGSASMTFTATARKQC